MIGTKKTVFGLALLFALGLAACGDDSSGTGAKKTDDAGNEEIQNAWDDADSVVSGVCNIHVCDKASEGERLYVLSSGKIYQCKSGTWLDSKGKEFQEQEFIDCFVEALVQDSVKTPEDLKACTSQKEGQLSVVSGDLVACASRKWVEIASNVISESDLPDCSEKTFVYVLGKMTAYECKDDAWYVGGKKVAVSETANPKSSSSQAKDDSSSQSSSSSAKPKSSSSVQVKDDGTKVRGVCRVSTTEVEKGQQVNYSFVNMGGTVVTYSWDFGNSASVKDSDDNSLSVSYSRGGTYRAKLVINEGRDSESDEIVCPGVHVAGTAVKNCTCNSDDENLVIREGNSANVTWTVSGCTGGSSFVYEWGDDVVASDASASKVLTEAGRVQPSVTVVNDDGESVEVVCSAVTASRPLSATCRFDVWGNAGQLSISNVQNPPGNQDELEFSLIGSEETKPQTVTMQGYCYDGNCNFWGANTPMNIVSPRYDLVFEGDTICTYASVKDCSCNEVELVSGSNELTESNPVQYRWTVSGCKDYGAGPLTYSWYGDNYEADDENPQKAIGTFTERGRYYASVKVTNSLGYSMTANCARASVTEAPYVETDLEEHEEVLSAGSYAIYSYVGGRSWLTWADEGEEIPDDLEDWFEQGLDTITTVEKLCGDSVTYQAYTINVSYPVLLTIPEGKSLALRECVLKGDDDE